MQFAHGTISGLQANCHPVSVKVLHKQLAACRGASNRATLQPLTFHLISALMGIMHSAWSPMMTPTPQQISCMLHSHWFQQMLDAASVVPACCIHRDSALLYLGSEAENVSRCGRRR